MEEEGADLIDVGGESSRPGSGPVPAREEIKRVVPVIEALAGRLGVPISVDTTKSEVAEAALAAGAEMVNDISGLTFDPALAEVVARHRAGLIVSHIRGRPRNMQKNPRYRHLIPEVIRFLQDSIRRALVAGVHRDAILVDPGIGFGKTVAHNLLLLRHLPALHSTGRPILLGASRKSFLGKLQEHGDAHDRLHGSLAVAALGVLSGVSVLRVHDVAETVEVFRVAKAVRDARMERPRE
jgi:dihydropteroate synthase